MVTVTVAVTVAVTVTVPATATWVAALDGLATAFSGSPASQTGIAAALRGAGLRVVSAVGPARAAIVRFASGV